MLLRRTLPTNVKVSERLTLQQSESILSLRRCCTDNILGIAREDGMDATVSCYTQSPIHDVDHLPARKSWGKLNFVNQSNLIGQDALVMRVIYRVVLGGVLLASASTVWAQGGGITAIRGATVLTSSEKGTIEDGVVILRGGKISDVRKSSGQAVPPMPGLNLIDAKGKYVTAGLIDAWSTLGLNPGGPIAPVATSRATDALDTFSRDAFADAVRMGVTGVCVAPPGAMGFSGTAAFVRLKDLNDLSGSTTDDVCLIAQVGIGAKGPLARLGELKSMRDLLETAAAYRDALDEYEEKLEDYKKALKDGKTVKLTEEEKKEEKKAKPKRKGRGGKGRRGRGRHPEHEHDHDEHQAPVVEDFATEDELTEAAFLEWLQALGGDEKDSHVPGDDIGNEHVEFDPTADPDLASDEPEKKKDDGKDKKDGDKKDDDELKKPEKPAYDSVSEVLVRAIKRELPIRIEVHQPADVLHVLKIVETYYLDATIVGGAGIAPVAEKVADAKLGLVVGQVIGAAGGVDRTHSRDLTLHGPAVAEHAAVSPLVLASGRRGNGTGGQYLTQNAALAVSGGMSADAALRAITIDAARSCNMASEIGSLEKGKKADVVIWSGHPLAPDSVVEQVFVDGVQVYAREEGQ